MSNPIASRPPAPLAAPAPAAAQDLAFVHGLAELAPRYDLVLCDVWGVLHNGLAPFPAARDALIRFRAEGGQVVLVSNAPRPGHVVGDQLVQFGVGPEAYDAIVTSGDLTRTIVVERPTESLFHLGPDRDLPIYEGIAVRFGDIETADYVVCTGLVDDEAETVADYAPLLQRMRERGLWMLCANPDIVVERGERLIFCAGALAAAYEELGGSTFYPGKPHRPVYERALKVAGALRGGAPPAPSRVLAIGDAIRTDVAGARAFGIDVLMIARGIHAAELGVEHGVMDQAFMRAWLGQQIAVPTAIMVELAWT
jgi:HAD superfamily hydrolase (TIGR01459 family)